MNNQSCDLTIMSHLIILMTSVLIKCEGMGLRELIFIVNLILFKHKIVLIGYG